MIQCHEQRNSAYRDLRTPFRGIELFATHICPSECYMHAWWPAFIRPKCHNRYVCGGWPFFDSLFGELTGRKPRFIVAQIQLAVNFARNSNLRLVVKNTGHDFNAKSTGAGSLSIWTHFLQDIEYLGDSYTSASGLEGLAFKVGSGITAEQLLSAADTQGVQVIGGLSRVRLQVVNYSSLSSFVLELTVP